MAPTIITDITGKCNKLIQNLYTCTTSSDLLHAYSSYTVTACIWLPLHLLFRTYLGTHMPIAYTYKCMCSYGILMVVIGCIAAHRVDALLSFTHGT